MISLPQLLPDAHHFSADPNPYLSLSLEYKQAYKIINSNNK